MKNMVNALEIWEDLSAALYQNLPKLWEPAIDWEQQQVRRQVLKQGSTDFDIPTGGIEPNEKVAHYIQLYMDMHLQQNRIAFKTYLPKETVCKAKVLCIDYGCGPMTSGLSLVEHLNDSPRNRYYYGIDISLYMCKYARRINSKYELFPERNCKICQADNLDIAVLDEAIDNFQPEVIVLCLSYVLANPTFKVSSDSDRKQKLEQLAKLWCYITSICSPTYAIYHNPNVNDWHRSWELFSRYVGAEAQKLSRDCRFEFGKLVEDCAWMQDKRPSKMGCIKGFPRRS